MATIGQRYYRVPSAANNTYDSNISATRLYSNVLADVAGADRFIKIGIQAPSGTQVVLNDKPIMIGRTGMYELDEDGISIRTMHFIRPSLYERDESASIEKEVEGMKKIDLSLAVRKDSVDDLSRYRNMSSISTTAYNNRVAEIRYEYSTTIKAIFDKYNQDADLSNQDANDNTLLNNAITTVIANLDSIRAAIPLSNTQFEQRYLAINDTFLSSYTEAKNIYTEGVNGVYIPLGQGDLQNVIIDFLYE